MIKDIPIIIKKLSKILHKIYIMYTIYSIKYVYYSQESLNIVEIFRYVGWINSQFPEECYWDIFHRARVEICSGGSWDKFHCSSEKLKDMKRLKQDLQAQKF